MSRLNLHRVFKGSPYRHGYLNKIEVKTDEKKLLKSADKIIRDAIRSEFSQLSEKYEDRQIFTESYFKHNRAILGGNQPPIQFTPKFMWQGSFQYKTANWPAHLPPQQVDLDDGIYVPMPYLNDEPTLRPSTYFAAVEAALFDLCYQYGWELDTSKNSCIRINMNSNNSHIDLPLYAVPKEEFSRFTESMASAQYDLNTVILSAVINSDRREGLRIKSDCVKLATRNEGWITSDPQSLNDWFEKSVTDHSSQLRRVSRYLKAWRDNAWSNGSKLTSIMLMTIAVEAYDEAFAKGSRPPEKRDDLAMLDTATYIRDKLESGYDIINPVLPSDVQNLTKGWEQEDRDEIVDAFYNLTTSLDSAINGGWNCEAALRHLRGEFGDRIPNDVTLIEWGSGPAEEVLTSVAAEQPAPEVPPHISG